MPPQPKYGWHGQTTNGEFAVGSRWKLSSGMVLEILPWVDAKPSITPDTYVRCLVIETSNSLLLQAFCPKGSDGYWQKATLEEYQDDE